MDVKDTQTGGGKCMGVRELFLGGCTCISPLWIINVDGENLRFQDAGGFPTQVSLSDDCKSASAADQRRMGEPPPSEKSTMEAGLKAVDE